MKGVWIIIKIKERTGFDKRRNTRVAGIAENRAMTCMREFQMLEHDQERHGIMC